MQRKWLLCSAAKLISGAKVTPGSEAKLISGGDNLSLPAKVRNDLAGYQVISCKTCIRWRQLRSFCKSDSWLKYTNTQKGKLLSGGDNFLSFCKSDTCLRGRNDLSGEISLSFLFQIYIFICICIAWGKEFAELAAVSNLQICFQHQRQIPTPTPSFPSNLVKYIKTILKTYFIRI